MKILIYYALIATFFLLSCNKKENSPSDCKIENPLIELNWLNDLKNSLTNCTCQISIMQAEYNGTTVFYTIMNDPVCDAVQDIKLYDCNGNVVKEYRYNEFDVFAKEVTNQHSIYSCKDE